VLQKRAVSQKLLELTKELQQVDSLKDFVLVGGTALALQIGHRTSVDIDLFTSQKIDRSKIESGLIKKYKNNYKRIFITENTITCLIRDIKIDILKYDYPYIDKVVNEEGIRIISLPDITAMKLDAITGNGSRVKDFVDIYFLLDKFPIDKMFDFYRTKYNHSDIYHVKKSLIYFNDLPPDSWATVNLLKKKELTLEIVKKRLTDELKNFDGSYKNINSADMKNTQQSPQKPPSPMKRHNIDDLRER
jgi:hypothetical protein